MHSDAASLQPSSKLVPLANTPPVTHCFNRPFFVVEAGVWAVVWARPAEAANAGMKSLRRMLHSYHRAAISATVLLRSRSPIMPHMPLSRLLFLLALAAQAQEYTVLKAARVFDGEAKHEAWAVRVRGN